MRQLYPEVCSDCPHKVNDPKLLLDGTDGFIGMAGECDKKRTEAITKGFNEWVNLIAKRKGYVKG